MFSLVKFNNDELQIVPTKRVQIGKNKQCTVNCKGSKYSAVVLKLHDSKEILEKEIENDNLNKYAHNKNEDNKMLLPANCESSENLKEILEKEIENDNLKTKKTRKKKRQAVHNKNKDKTILLPADCESSENVSKEMAVPNKNKDNTILLPVDCESSENVSKEILENEIKNDNLKTKKAKQKKRNLLRVKLTDTLDIDKARNSSLRIICDTVITGGQPVHNKNEDDTFIDTILLPENCESCENVADLPLEQLIKKYDFDSNIETVDQEMGAEISYCHLSPVDPEIEFEISTGHDELAPINVSKTLTNASDSTYVPDQTTSVKDISQISQKSETFNKCLPVDVRKVTVPQSKTSDTRRTKKYFCPFCNKLQTKFARHLELLHYS
ncbi:uncharacterized protein LOC133530632 [Cydia pomonella]|nr:uncharacterized protein LOC133530632 [Cydia pomonella]